MMQKDRNSNRKKPYASGQCRCKELAIVCEQVRKEYRVVATDSLWVYQCCEGITILIKALLMIGAVVNYGICARDRPEGNWGFSRHDSDEHP